MEEEAFNLGYIEKMYLKFRHLKLGQLSHSYLLVVSYYYLLLLLVIYC